MQFHTVESTSKITDWFYKELFQQIPFNIAIIDQNFNIIEANDNFTEYFGEWRGKKCYKAYKNLDKPCRDCNAVRTFQDGKSRVSDESGLDQYGKESHYVVHIAPLKKDEDSHVDYIIEMSTDFTETKRWQRQYNLLFDRVPCYITVIDRNFNIIRANETFRENFGDVIGKHCYEVYKKRKRKCPNCPAAKTFKDGKVHHSNQTGIKKSGEKAHYLLTTSRLSRGTNEQDVAHVIEISTDITETKKLEQEVIEAERLAAVGQTVAGLAHSIKNILMGLEGGMYIVSTGLNKDDKIIISQGWEMLERNFEKTTTLVKDFLSFSKGRLPELQIINPNDLVNEIIDLYQEIAKNVHVNLIANLDAKIKSFPLDPKGIHTCLTNLVSNAIDACQMSEKENCSVQITTKDEKGMLKFIVTDDGCGMDYEIKQKVFTTFFTTKGGKGTGLGLLTTKKIVQEHGGTITVSSKADGGAKFKMEFPKKRLFSLYNKQE
jgi:PAS domain S-box-containing protein